MCGRFALYTPASRIAEVFEVLDPVDDLPARFNVAPTDPVPVVLENKEGVRKLGMVRWGLIPWFQKDAPPKGPPLINARAETVATKPAFRDAFRRKRCLVPADGFYEWRKDGKERLPYLFRRKDHGLLALAGVWDSFTNADGERVGSCAVLTTDANALVAPLHDRMPAILHPGDWAEWLSRDEADFDRWRDRLAPYPAEEMERIRVDKRVNSVKNDDSSLIEPAPDTP